MVAVKWFQHVPGDEIEHERQHHHVAHVPRGHGAGENAVVKKARSPQKRRNGRPEDEIAGEASDVRIDRHKVDEHRRKQPYQQRSGYTKHHDPQS